MKSLSNLVLFVLGWGASLVACAYTLKTLWGWFVVTTFNLPALTMGSAIGLDLVISFLFSSFVTKGDLDLLKDEDAPVMLNSVGRGLFFSAFFLLMGYLVHRYAM